MLYSAPSGTCYSAVLSVLLLLPFVSQTLAADADALPADEYLRRIQNRATRIGNYVYIDGGQVSDPDYDNGKSGPLDVETTLSLDISESWDPKKVKLNQIPRQDSMQQKLKQGIFNDESDGSFFIYGGHVDQRNKPEDRNIMWKFVPDNQGGGRWTDITPQNPEEFGTYLQTEGGAFASSTDAAFWIGGNANGGTLAKESDDGFRGAVTGILSYNFTTKMWANDSSDELIPGKSVWGASATYIPTFGPNGLVALLGGVTNRKLPGQGTQSFGDVAFFDPVTKDVYKQKAKGMDLVGDVPPGRISHCAVGAEGNNGTYEIFIYAGAARPDTDGRCLHDMWVLSLPGFIWRKVDDSTTDRTGLACVGLGDRHLLSVGGYNHTMGASKYWVDPDPFPQGLGIFDMTDLEWKDTYDADAGKYQTSDVLRSWYDEGGMDKVDWSSEEVKKLFTSSTTKQRTEEDGGTSSKKDTQTPSAQDDSPSSTDSPASNPSSDSSSGNRVDDEMNEESDDDIKTPVGVVAGAVVGGIAGVLIIGAVAWCIMRRKNESRMEIPSEEKSKWPRSGHELPTIEQSVEMEGSTKFVNTPQSPGPIAEMDGTSRHSFERNGRS